MCHSAFEDARGYVGAIVVRSAVN